MTTHVCWIRMPVLCIGRLIALTPCARAGSSASANYTISADSVDGGGQRTTSALYQIDASVGGVGGIASNAGRSATVKAGYIGQLTEVTTLTRRCSKRSFSSSGFRVWGSGFRGKTQQLHLTKYVATCYIPRTYKQ